MVWFSSVAPPSSLPGISERSLSASMVFAFFNSALISKGPGLLVLLNVLSPSSSKQEALCSLKRIPCNGITFSSPFCLRTGSFCTLTRHFLVMPANLGPAEDTGGLPLVKRFTLFRRSVH